MTDEASHQGCGSSAPALNRRAETKPGIVRTQAVFVTFAIAEDIKAVCQNCVALKGTR